MIDRHGATVAPARSVQPLACGIEDEVVDSLRNRQPLKFLAAHDPIRMAKAFADSVRAGRGALLAGPMVAQEFAVPSTPEFRQSVRLRFRQSRS